MTTEREDTERFGVCPSLTCECGLDELHVASLPGVHALLQHYDVQNHLHDRPERGVHDSAHREAALSGDAGVRKTGEKSSS